MRYFIFVSIVLFGCLNVQAQGKIGFKTGINISKIKSPGDIDNSGNVVESWDHVTGFHLGVTYTYPFNDYFMVRGEGLYSKKGGKYKHIGQMHRTFFTTNQSVLTRGNGSYLVQVSSICIDLPITAVIKYKKFELTGGIYGSLIAASTGEGALAYSGVTAAGTRLDTLNATLIYDYFRDKPGESSPGSASVNALLDGKSYTIFSTQGAYYNNADSEKEKQYNRLDYGLIGGVAYYFNSTLYIGARLQYGLADLTNNAGHYSVARTQADGKPLLRNSKDTNMTWQLGVGFSF